MKIRKATALATERGVSREVIQVSGASQDGPFSIVVRVKDHTGRSDTTHHVLYVGEEKVELAINEQIANSTLMFMGEDNFLHLPVDVSGLNLVAPFKAKTELKVAPIKEETKHSKAAKTTRVKAKAKVEPVAEPVVEAAPVAAVEEPEVYVAPEAEAPKEEVKPKTRRRSKPKPNIKFNATRPEHSDIARPLFTKHLGEGWKERPALLGLAERVLNAMQDTVDVTTADGVVVDTFEGYVEEALKQA
jgi:hypothetical protein